MKNLFWLLLAVLCAVLVTALSPGAAIEAAPAPQVRPTLTPTPAVPAPVEESPQAPVASGSASASPVFGRVLMVETTSPVAGARVTFRIDANRVWHATTDAQGAFTFPDAGEGWGYLDVQLPAGIEGRSVTGPVLLLAERAAPVELVWGVTQAGRRPPISPVIRSLGPIHTTRPTTADIEVHNTTDYKTSRTLLTVRAPEGVYIVGAQSNHGAIVATGDTVAFRLDGMAPGERVTVQVALQARSDAAAGNHDLSTWLVYGEFVAAETHLSTAVNGRSFLPQTGLPEVLVGLLQAGFLLALVVVLAGRRLRTAHR